MTGGKVCHCEGTQCPWQSPILWPQSVGDSISTEKRDCFVVPYGTPRNDGENRIIIIGKTETITGNIIIDVQYIAHL